MPELPSNRLLQTHARSGGLLLMASTHHFLLFPMFHWDAGCFLVAHAPIDAKETVGEHSEAQAKSISPEPRTRTRK